MYDQADQSDIRRLAQSPDQGEPLTALRISLAVAAVSTAALGVPAFADKPGDTDTTKTSKGQQIRYCGDAQNTLVLDGSQILWPPNHKMVDEVVTATSTGEAMPMGTTAFTLEAASVEDVAGGDGSPNQDTDGDGVSDSSAATMATDTDGDRSATAIYQVRAERSGKGTGRTYTINWQATFDDGSMCTSGDEGQSPFTIFVPHDQGQGKATGRTA
jgi:hypothetical protein